jgi:hypothetical protein
LTLLSTTLARLTPIEGIRKPVVVTLHPCGGNRDALLSFRPARSRVRYVLRLADCYRLAALWHGNKERAAKSAARKEGVPWRTARKAFLRSLVPPQVKRKRKEAA